VSTGLIVSAFPVIRQRGKWDCGGVCLEMIGRYYGRDCAAIVAEWQGAHPHGATLAQLCVAAELIGLSACAVEMSLADLRGMNEPCIAHVNRSHFVVVLGTTEHEVTVADPLCGLLCLSIEAFAQQWATGTSDSRGILILLEPSD
jgi:ATP-binding cassette subfamily B protein